MPCFAVALSGRSLWLEDLQEILIQYSQHTAGPGWCFPWKNPLRDTFCDFQRIFPTETQKVFLKEKSEKHIMCFFQVSHR